ncbi:MAG: metal ABC transporter ATP-binding protein [Planctomycetes bacterium]|nr:metal ABC transporter ATP-binding protein [Planctomycetota bacterium]
MSTDEAALLEARGAAFGYGGRAIVQGVDLVVRPGALVGIAGPNGAGKTTLFRGLLGLLKPLAGEVRRGPHPIGYVPQREVYDAVFPLTVEEVVHLGAAPHFRGVQRFWRALGHEEHEFACRCLDRVGLHDQRRAPFASLSGGQRQRVLLARALMARPRLLVLDEPTSGVDRAAAAKILEVLRDLQAREGLAVLIVSHELPLLRAMAQEVLWVAEGRVQHGDAEALLSPESLDRLFAGETVEAHA